MRVFQRFGWSFLRQAGSHMILGKQGIPFNLSVPDHREIRKGTLRNLIRRAGMDVNEFLDLLDS